MAEAAAPIIAIIMISDRVIGLCKYYIGGLKDAPADLRAILIETSTLKTILENVQFLTTCGDGNLASGLVSTFQDTQSGLRQRTHRGVSIQTRLRIGEDALNLKVEWHLGWYRWPHTGL